MCKCGHTSAQRCWYQRNGPIEPREYLLYIKHPPTCGCRCHRWWRRLLRWVLDWPAPEASATVPPPAISVKPAKAKDDSRQLSPAIEEFLKSLP